MGKSATRIEQFKGVNVPIFTDQHGNDHISLWVRRSPEEVMFCDGHGGATAKLRNPEDKWVPVSMTLPTKVAPRAGLEDGIVTTLEQLMNVYYKDVRVLC